MYIPAHFAASEEVVTDLLLNHGAADLVTVTEDGLLATFCGTRSAALALAKVSASGPCEVYMLCRLAPPGSKPSAFAS